MCWGQDINEGTISLIYVVSSTLYKRHPQGISLVTIYC